MTNQVIAALLKGIIWFLNIFSWLIIINSLLSWVVDPTHPIRSLIERIIEPFVSPFRQFTSKMNSSGLPFDFSPLFAYIFLRIVIIILDKLVTQIMY